MLRGVQQFLAAASALEETATELAQAEEEGEEEQEQEQEQQQEEEGVVDAAQEERVRRASMLLVRMKGLNREVHARLEAHRQRVQAKQQAVDAQHLMLENLLYERKHLHAEIERCQSFSARELRRVEQEAQTQIAQRSALEDPARLPLLHVQALEALQAEMQQRKDLCEELSRVKEARARISSEVETKTRALQQLPRQVGQLHSAARALRQAFSQGDLATAEDAEREQMAAQERRRLQAEERVRLAHQLPAPLYKLFNVLRSYQHVSEVRARQASGADRPALERDTIQVSLGPSDTPRLSAVAAAFGLSEGDAERACVDLDGACPLLTDVLSPTELAVYVRICTQADQSHRTALAAAQGQEESDTGATNLSAALRFQYVPALEAVTVSVLSATQTDNIFPDADATQSHAVQRGDSGASGTSGNGSGAGDKDRRRKGDKVFTAQESLARLFPGDTGATLPSSIGFFGGIGRGIASVATAAPARQRTRAGKQGDGGEAPLVLNMTQVCERVEADLLGAQPQEGSVGVGGRKALWSPGVLGGRPYWWVQSLCGLDCHPRAPPDEFGDDGTGAFGSGDDDGVGASNAAATAATSGGGRGGGGQGSTTPSGKRRKGVASSAAKAASVASSTAASVAASAATSSSSSSAAGGKAGAGAGGGSKRKRIQATEDTPKRRARMLGGAAQPGGHGGNGDAATDPLSLRWQGVLPEASVQHVVQRLQTRLRSLHFLELTLETLSGKRMPIPVHPSFVRRGIFSATQNAGAGTAGETQVSLKSWSEADATQTDIFQVGPTQDTRCRFGYRYFLTEVSCVHPSRSSPVTLMCRVEVPPDYPLSPPTFLLQPRSSPPPTSIEVASAGADASVALASSQGTEPRKGGVRFDNNLKAIEAEVNGRCSALHLHMDMTDAETHIQPGAARALDWLLFHQMHMLITLFGEFGACVVALNRGERPLARGRGRRRTAMLLTHNYVTELPSSLK